MPIDKSPANLQSIPPELRMLILDYLLVDSNWIDLSDLHRVDGMIAPQPVEHFRNLSIQCRQMHDEAESIFFARNTFGLLANGTLPMIPAHQVERMKNIELYRTMVGRTFVLKIHRAHEGTVETSVEVDVHRGQPYSSLQKHSQMGDIIESRLTKGAEVAVRMIQRSVEDGEGVGMAVMQAIASNMNQQWIIAI